MSDGEEARHHVTRPVYGLARIDPQHFVMRLLQDCLDQQTIQYWLRRAEDFDDCNPFLALQCRRHAWILSETQNGEISEDVRNVLREAIAC